MKPTVLIFSLFMMTILQASHIPTDSVHNPEFQKKINFYAKYGTVKETKEVIGLIFTLEQQNKEQQAFLNNSLLQASSSYINANNRIALNTKILNDKTITPVNLHATIAIAQQDSCNAWYNFQTSSFNKNLAEQDAAELVTLRKLMMLRHDRLQLRSQQRDLTVAQAKFQEEKKQAALEKISRTKIESKTSKDFKKAQNQIKPLLNRMIKQASSMQQTPCENLLSDYIAKAQQESQLTQEKKQRKITFKAQKNLERQAQLLIEREKLRQEKEAQNKISKDLQALAFQKGASQPIIPTPAERLAQSTKDKEIAREQLETHAMTREEVRTRTLFPQPQSSQKATIIKESVEKISIPQNILDEAVMLSGRLANLKDFDFNTNDRNQEQIFLTTVLTFERIIDKNPSLFQTIESDCKQAIKANIQSYQKQLQDIKDRAPFELEQQNKRSLELDAFKINKSANTESTNRFIRLKQEERAFLELIEQDNLLRSATNITQLLEKKLDGSLTESLPIQNYLTTLPPKYYGGSPFLSYRQEQQRLEQSYQKNLATNIDSFADITKLNQVKESEKRPSVYTLHPKVCAYIRSKIFEIATGAHLKTEDAQLADFITKEIKFIFPDAHEDQRNLTARIMVARGLKEFDTYKKLHIKTTSAHEATQYAKNHRIAIYKRVQSLYQKDTALTASDIEVLSKIECMVFEAYFAHHCSALLEAQAEPVKHAKKGVSRKA